MAKVFETEVVKGPSNFFSDISDHIDPDMLGQETVTDIDQQDATTEPVIIDNAKAESGVNAFLDLDGDDFPVEDTPNEAPPATEVEETPVAETEQDETREAPVTPADDDDPFADHSEAALMAMAFKQDGWIEGEVDKDLDYVKLKELISNKISATAEQAKEEALNQVEDKSKYVEFLLNGGDPKALQEAVSYEGLVKMDLEEVANQETIVRAGYESQNLEKVEIDALLETLKDKGQLKSKATSFQGGFKNYQESIINRDKETRKKQQEQYANDQKQNQAEVETIIRSGDIGGLKLEKSEQDQLLNALTKPTEVFTYQDDSGKKKQVKVTKIQMLEHKMQNNKQMQLQYAHLLLNGFNLKDVVGKEVQNENDRLMEHLNARTTNKARIRKRKSSGNAFDDIAERTMN